MNSAKRISLAAGHLFSTPVPAKLADLLPLGDDGHTAHKPNTDNLITTSGKKLQLTRMLGTTVIPILILLAFTGHQFILGVMASVDSYQVRKTLRFSTELAELLYALQNERDMSALYVSDLSRDVPKEFLVENYPVTDGSINTLSYWPAIEGDSHYSSKEAFYNFLNRHRYELDTQNPTLLDELDFYSDAIEVFINWLYSALTEAQSGTVWKDLVALVETVEGLTFAGIERAIGSLFYINGGFPSRDTYLLFRKAQDVGNYSITHAKDYSRVAAAVYRNTIQNEKTFFEVIEEKRGFIKATTLEQIDEFTNLITSNEETLLNGSLVDAQYWFSNMTVYLDAILEIQQSLIAIINDELEDQGKEDRKILFILAGLFFTVVILSPIILKSVYVLTKDFHKYSLVLAESTRALEVERKRVYGIMHQLLPKAIIQRYRKGELVQAEKFAEVTVCCATFLMHGRFSYRTSPVQIVKILDNLCMEYDRVIERYDCARIETVGGQYMIVSGLPDRNGNDHVFHIANMSLDLLRSVRNADISHPMADIFRIHIGVHTGVCAAGVINHGIPQYVIFGATVQTAMMLEDTSKPGKVHISEKTNTLLKTKGVYMTKRRERRGAEGWPSLKSYWLMGRTDTGYDLRSDSSQSLVLEDSDTDISDSVDSPDTPDSLQVNSALRNRQ